MALHYIGTIMSQFINLSVVLIIGFFCSQTHAERIIHLAPNETKVLSNSSPWTINAQCTIQGTEQTKGRIRISVLKNKGSVNGKNLTTGQATSVTVKNHSNISVRADAGTEINLINLSSEDLQANCAT